MVLIFYKRGIIGFVGEEFNGYTIYNLCLIRTSQKPPQVILPFYWLYNRKSKILKRLLFVEL